MISLIVALDQDGCIGQAGRVPWRLSADLRRFKALTMGHFLIVGRKTCESIGRPLPGRRMVVVTRQPAYTAPGYQVAGSLDEALALARAAGETETFIGGGGQIYAQALPLAGCIYLTRVQARIEGCDTFFPAFDPQTWTAVEQQAVPAGEHDQFASLFQKLLRVPPLVSG